jgi:hypothetical protein
MTITGDLVDQSPERKKCERLTDGELLGEADVLAMRSS